MDSIKKLAFILLLGILFNTLIVSAGISSLPPVKINTCINLPQGCQSCTFQNITYIQLPDKTILNINSAMTDNGNGFFNYTFCNNTQAGTYIVNGYGDEPDEEVWAYSYDATATGNERINSGEGLSLVITIAILIIVTGFFFILGLKFENFALRLIFIGTSAIIFVIGILYALVILTQTLGSFSDIVEGYTTFWFVMKILVGIGITTLVFISLIISWNVWMKKRGFRD